MAVKCQAIRCQDEYQCGRCGLSWSVSDRDKPQCKTENQRTGERTIKEILSTLKPH